MNKLKFAVCPGIDIMQCLGGLDNVVNEKFKDQDLKLVNIFLVAGDPKVYTIAAGNYNQAKLNLVAVFEEIPLGEKLPFNSLPVVDGTGEPDMGNLAERQTVCGHTWEPLVDQGKRIDNLWKCSRCGMVQPEEKFVPKREEKDRKNIN